MGKIYGYARCSTNEKRQDLERQVKELQEQGANKIYKEYASGAKENRKQWQKLLEKLKQGDTVIATELSRLTRSLHTLCHLYEDAIKRKIKLILGNITFDCTQEKIEPFPLAMLQIMGVFAELERNIDIDRINSGLKNAKEKGIKLGRPKKTKKDIPTEIKEQIKSIKNGITKVEIARKTGLSRPTIDKYIKLMQ